MFPARSPFSGAQRAASPSRFVNLCVWRCEVDLSLIVPAGPQNGSVGRDASDPFPGAVGGGRSVANSVGGHPDHDLRRSPTL